MKSTLCYPHQLLTASLSILVVVTDLRNTKVWIFSHAWVICQLGVMYNPDTFDHKFWLNTKCNVLALWCMAVETEL